MSTYTELRDKVLTLTDQVGVTDSSNVAKVGLEEAMKYVASKVYIQALHPTATYTWQDGDTEISILADFGVSDFETPVGLFVDEIPYDYREYFQWLSLRNSPGGQRYYLTDPGTSDERPGRVWTINESDSVEIYPDPRVDDEILLIYRTIPAPFGDGSGSPEIPSLFEGILMSGAELVVKQYVRDPETVLDFYSLFKVLDPHIQELDFHLNSKRNKFQIKLSRSYRIPHYNRSRGWSVI